MSDGSSVGDVSNLSDQELLDLHECILSVCTTGTCERNDCQEDADVIASAPCSDRAFNVCAGCLPDHVEWFETEPAEREAQTVAREVAASLNPEVEYVR